MCFNIAIFSNAAKEIEFREVRIQVVDELDLEPIEGVTVYRVNIIYKLKRLYIFGHLIGEAKDIKTYYVDKYVTDSHGEVIIPQKMYSVKKNQYVYKESIYINLETYDTDSTVSEKANDLISGLILYRPNKRRVFMPFDEYKAVHILSTPYPLDHRWDQLEESKKYYTLIKNGHDVPEFDKKQSKLEPRSLYSDKESFVVKLGRQKLE